MVDPTAPDTAWPNGGSLYSSKLTIFFSSIKRHRKKEGKKYKNEKKKKKIYLIITCDCMT